MVRCSHSKWYLWFKEITSFESKKDDSFYEKRGEKEEMTETKKKKIKFINCTKITDYFYTQAGIFKKKKKKKKWNILLNILCRMLLGCDPGFKNQF
jgi:hypothetical protein